MEDLDALLADLHNTTVNLNQSGSTATSPSGGYGSVSSAKQQQQQQQLPQPGDDMAATSSYTTRTVTTERHEYRHNADPAMQPIYQNQHMMREIKTTTPEGHLHGGGGTTLNLSSNLFELDNLLEDLNAARCQQSYKERKSPSTNGPPVSYSSREIEGPPRSPALGHPTIESLLDELQSAVPPRTGSPSHRMYATTTTSELKTSSAPQTAASSATKELDDLMASLSDFKVNANSAQHSKESDPAYAKPQKAKSNRGNQLESMLGTLQSDMSKQGVNTAAKGHCTACNKPIVGQVVTALGKTWHPEHFTCAHCNQELGTKNFFERDGEPYCETDYHNIFSPRCAYCNGPILDKCVTALDKTWHPEHFFCAQCGRQFGEEGFHEKDGKPFCREDYFDMFAPKCGGCNRPITENYISALNSQWHPECFVCRDCRQSFSGGSFYDHDGQPYCETHYHAKRGSLCAGCHKPITGRCITAMFRKFHPEHFVCSFCLKQLNKGTFKEQNDKPYCHPCFDKLFG